MWLRNGSAIRCTPQIFGDAGRYARSAVGVNELPAGFAVEVELVAEV